MADESDRPVLYDEAAHLLRLLLAAGFKLQDGASYHATIGEMARVMGVALKRDIGHNDLAEYLHYRIAGIPDPRTDKRERQKHQAMIGSFFGNLPADAKRAALSWKSEAARMFARMLAK